MATDVGGLRRERATMSNTTIYLHYSPEGGDGGKPVKLKLVLPPNKTVMAVTKAFAKAVAKSRPEFEAIDLGKVAVTRFDGSVVESIRTVGDAFREGEELRLSPMAEPNCPDDGRPALAAPKGNAPPQGCWPGWQKGEFFSPFSRAS